jgi:putative ABC transport system substrate-binding protein
MHRRNLIVVLGGAAVTWPLAAQAQQPLRSRQIGLLIGYEESNPQAKSWVAAFRESLAKLGWTDGRNVKFEERWVGTDPNRIQQAGKELIALQPDLIVAGSSPITLSILHQTRTIPIVFVQVIDPVAQGFVESLSHPGGNATGLVNLETSMTGKWLELLKEVMPSLSRVAVPFNPASAPYADLYLNYFKSAALPLGIEIIGGAVSDFAAVETFIAAQAREQNTGVIPMPSSFASGNISEMAAIMLRHRLPSLYVIRAFAEAGGLLSYGNNIEDNYRQAATFVDRILKGDKPSELPVQFPTKFELVANLKTAKMLDLRIPQQLLAVADDIIE